MFIKANITMEGLLLGTPIELLFSEKEGFFSDVTTLWIKQPTLGLLYSDSRFNAFVNFLNTPIETIKAKSKTFKNIENHFDVFDTPLKGLNVEAEYYNEIILHGFKCLDLNIEPLFDFYAVNQMQLTCNFFNEVRNVVLISLGLEKINIIKETPRERDARLKVEAIRKKNKKASPANVSYTNFEKNIIILKYEFGLSMNEIQSLTVFAMNAILSYTSGSVRYKTSVAAVAAGNAKKINFITDKEKK